MSQPQREPHGKPHFTQNIHEIWNFSWFEVYQTDSVEATHRPVPVLTFSPISSFAAPTSCLSLGPGLGLGETDGEAVAKSVVPPIRVALSEVEYTPGYNWQIV